MKGEKTNQRSRTDDTNPADVLRMNGQQLQPP
jgi:hypothetical protein